ncbi:hypothetical protein [Nitratifractor salsuginis]|uniref:HPr kinase n=1 Tax=Nitratifractor salsuginis (strain DSM 16511 / JCM 12458 / E9I37-1) TaxID=749222 RepID=E6X1Z8_NITSE|nr:hypothetical protein [Nitratifractor salsuginis]ADV46006.1 hypothetical protein Nitsa_0739 [Nitratifractor salsuginis DSM 16511]
MIHGHQFLFVDQQSLQEEYDSFKFSHSGNDRLNTIEVREIDTYQGFERRSSLLYLSGRGCYYLSNTSPEKIERDHDWGLEIVNVLTLVWDGKSRRILYAKGRDFTPRLLQFWIYHTFFPIALELERNYTMLHVGAVEIDGGVVFFSAPSFGGKSTLTDYFIGRGHTLFADDTLPIKQENGEFIVYPSFPYHRPYRQPETLGRRVENFAGEPALLKALFELRQCEPNDSIDVRPLEGIEKFRAFYQSVFVSFSFMKKERFEFFAKMAMKTPAYRVSIPWDKERLPEVYNAIVKQLQDQSQVSIV